MSFPLEKKRYVVRAVSTPTASYVAGTVFSMDDENFVGIQVAYTKGDETKITVKVEASLDEGTTYGQQVAESTSGGTVTVSLAEREFSATGNYLFIISPLHADLVKISVKSTGGSPTGTVGIKAITAWA